MKDKKAFTLIELIAVLVILAILALIVTPLILNIVRKAKDSANKRNIDAYGKAVELSIATYLLDNGDFPTSINDLTVEYSGSEVVCKVQKLNEDSSVYLSECKVGNSEVKDSSTNDGWYHYGKANKLTYQSYSIGDEVTYNGMNFYVIADSDENSDSVTVLKAEPLTVDEVNTYGKDHVNKYTKDSSGTAYNINGYGGIAYYSSETCGYINDSWIETECITDYDSSEVKYVVDAWASDKFKSNDLNEDDLGYKVRLITYDECVNNTKTVSSIASSGDILFTEEIFPWINGYNYWTMSTYEDSNKNVYVINFGNLGGYVVHAYRGGYIADTVRPVVTLKKSAI